MPEKQSGRRLQTQHRKRPELMEKAGTVKKTGEDSKSLQVTVHSKNRYQIAHLLEHGHAKRGGGRVAARPHIAPAEETGICQLEEEIERGIRNG